MFCCIFISVILTCSSELQSAQLTSLSPDSIRSIAKLLGYPTIKEIQLVVTVDDPLKGLNYFAECDFSYGLVGVNKQINTVLNDQNSEFCSNKIKIIKNSIWRFVSNTNSSHLRSFLRINFCPNDSMDNALKFAKDLCSSSHLSIQRDSDFYLFDPDIHVSTQVGSQPIIFHANLSQLHLFLANGANPYLKNYKNKNLISCFKTTLLKDYERLSTFYEFPILFESVLQVSSDEKYRKFPMLLQMLGNWEKQEDNRDYFNINYPYITSFGLQRILYRNKEQINYKDSSGKILLSYALKFPFKNKDLKKYIIELLIEVGSNIDLLSPKQKNHIQTEFAYIFKQCRLEYELHNFLMQERIAQRPCFLKLEDLLRRGADPTIKINNKLPIELVLSSTYTSMYKIIMLRLLYNYGVSWNEESEKKNKLLCKKECQEFKQKKRWGIPLNHDIRLQVMKTLGLFSQPFSKNNTDKQNELFLNLSAESIASNQDGNGLYFFQPEVASKLGGIVLGLTAWWFLFLHCKILDKIMPFS